MGGGERGRGGGERGGERGGGVNKETQMWRWQGGYWNVKTDKGYM
jgi:hypothetical protein